MGKETWQKGVQRSFRSLEGTVFLPTKMSCSRESLFWGMLLDVAWVKKVGEVRYV